MVSTEITTMPVNDQNGVQSQFVAVVDDDEHIGQAISMWLNMLGTPNQIFKSGESLFNALETSSAQLPNPQLSALKAAILDLNLPGSNGIEIAQRLRAAKPNLPIALISAVNSEDLSTFGAMPDGVVFFKKPFELEDLESALQL